MSRHLLYVMAATLVIVVVLLIATHSNIKEAPIVNPESLPANGMVGRGVTDAVINNTVPKPAVPAIQEVPATNGEVAPADSKTLTLPPSEGQ